jgi:hypothetical protein
MKSKSVFTVVLFYLMIAMLMISIHHNMNYGFASSYGFYMITLVAFLGYTYRKINETKEENDTKSVTTPPKPKDIFKGKRKSKSNN